MKHTQFQVKQLRSRNIVTILMSMSIYLATFFTVAILPSLLIRYVYADQQLFQQPPLLDYIPVVGFAISTLYFLYAVVVVVRREMMANRMTNMVSTTCNCGHADCAPSEDDLMVSDEEIAELEKIVEEAMKSAPEKKKSTSKSAKKSSSKKKTSRKTSKK